MSVLLSRSDMGEFRRRPRWLAVVVVLLFLTLTARVFYMQVINGDEYRAPALVFATIQKYAERDVETPEDEEGGREPVDPGDFPVLNEDDSILVMVDEAHRSHTSALHGNLLKALPNCARIGFTGTPIIMGAKKRTTEIFGDLLDRSGVELFFHQVLTVNRSAEL